MRETKVTSNRWKLLRETANYLSNPHGMYARFSEYISRRDVVAMA